MYDNVATLKSVSRTEYDEHGNELLTYSDRLVYVLPRSVYNSEFYNAAQVGLHPSLVLTMNNRADYQGEKLVEFEGQLYDVIRTDWTAQRDGIALTLQRRVGNG